ncbi:BEN domain-containing protein 6 isoform X1 [Pleurodeles waltl]|uniref:BEN domain-containing protein 6 isoform X1 n=1 Tax=Pleurodeles waltl TaxID=8319 RepID=UPI003709A40F
MMQNLLQLNAITKGAGLGKRKKIINMLSSDSVEGNLEEEQPRILKRIKTKSPSFASVNITSNLESSPTVKQEEHQSKSALLYSDSSSEEDDPMYHLSKLELRAKIRSLKRKLAHSVKENSRLRQSLVLFQVLPKAVTHFEELVGKADALLKGGMNSATSNILPQTSCQAQNTPVTEPVPAAHSNCSSPLLLPVMKEEPTVVKQFKIEKWQIALCNKSKPQKFINDLMQALHTHEYMATHSLTGAKSSSSKDRAPKPAMNQNEVQEIIGITKQLFPDTDDALIRRMMAQKLNNCTKKQIASKDHSSASKNHNF